MSQQRYEKEIEEILEKAGESPDENRPQDSTPAPRRSRGSPPPGRGPAGRRFSLKYQYALIAGIALIVLGAVLGWLFFFLAGVALVVAGYIIYYRAPRGSAGTPRIRQMWRGRPVDPDDPPDGWRRR